MARRKVTWIKRANLYHRGERVYALVDPNTWTIEIDEDALTERQRLYNEIHELVHIRHPDWSERRVDREALFYRNHLYPRGWRLKTPPRT